MTTRQRRFTDEERRARLAVRHRLAPSARADTVEDASLSVVWTGWTARETRAAIAASGAAAVALDDGHTGFVLADDLEPTSPTEAWVALLPPLDPTTMGWYGRDWYLGPHRSALFDTAGNAGPTIWVDGRIVGGWGVLASGEVVTRLLEDPGREASDAIEAERARLTTWLGAAGAVPRFATPLARELVRQGPGGQTGG